MTPRLHVVLGGAAVIALVMTIAIRQSPRPEPVTVSPLYRPPMPVEDDANRQLGIDALKSAITAPRVVKTETIAPTTTEVIEPEPEPKPAIRPPRDQRDVCQRHRMRKVYYGKTWRCKK
jgi:hypothetical protein